MNYNNHTTGKHAQEILALQHPDGTWGEMFHSFAKPNGKSPLMTEQALLRLKALGFTVEDEPIRRIVKCMVSCLKGERTIDNYREKGYDWDLFSQMMLTAWVRVFEPDNEVALEVAKQWARVIETAFAKGQFSQAAYSGAFAQEFAKNQTSIKEIGFTIFYPMNLLQGVLTEETERRMLDYVLASPGGIYYIYAKPLNQLPAEFASKETSYYLAAIEILAGYKTAKEKLGFVVDWLESNRDENGQWDLGAKAKDNVYFPLLDSWRKGEDRKADCTERIEKLLERIK
ncbi:MAG: hypothetical protein J6K04_10820 [Lachnospiraceae bacterium]|nr:hypothetical protein [Lachnospiraceae bacterium]